MIAKRSSAVTVVALLAAWSPACDHAPPAPGVAPLAIPSAALVTDGSANPDASSPTAPDEALSVIVRSVRGRVEAQSLSGALRVVMPGEKLRSDDVLRTGPDSSVTIGMNAATVEIHPRSRLSVTEVAKDVSRVLLSAGRVSADLPEGGGQRLRVDVPRSDASATSSGGRFSAITGGGGELAVAGERGKVQLTSHDRTVDVPAGEQSVAYPGLAPTRSSKIPLSLFLKVGRPPARVQRTSTTELSGVTQPGTIVTVGGKTARTDARGRFTVVVPLDEGTNVLSVVASDATGRRVQKSAGKVVVRSKAPPVNSRVRW